MRSKAEVTSLLIKPGVIAVVRAKARSQAVPVTEALVAGGVVAVEITMTTPDAIDAIRDAVKALGPCALIGVGTVLDVETCQKAIEAGAEFVVSPICRPELVKVAQASDRPIMLGAYTPTEAQQVHESGADFVKLFPADNLGPAYIKALRAPLPHLRIVPTGGVDLGNIGEYFKAGCAAVGLGSSLVSAAILERSDWPALTVRAKEFVSKAREAKA
jgi:2-dehydro-3-deoxyphosphogluconate aldolase/(4S)-4-hydroxy-2-oxoglutarate aldolase